MEKVLIFNNDLFHLHIKQTLKCKDNIQHHVNQYQHTVEQLKNKLENK